MTNLVCNDNMICECCGKAFYMPTPGKPYECPYCHERVFKGESIMKSVWEKYLQYEADLIAQYKKMVEQKYAEIIAKDFPELIGKYTIEWQEKSIPTTQEKKELEGKTP